jgi:large subunit ribosomal protein L23
MKDLRAIIRRPLLTERSTELKEKENKYFFEVTVGANKIEIKKAVEALFNVKVKSVNTMIKYGKNKRMGRTQGRTSDYKKAVVTLKEGSSIDIFVGA